MPRPSVLALLALAALPAAPQLVRDWHRVRTEHFELVSRYDPARTAPLLTELEWARAVFEVNFGTKSRVGRRVLVFLPDSPYEFEQMVRSPLPDGFYAGVPWRDIIVLRQLLNTRRSLLHEYTHLIMHHEGGRWPAWFQEGCAEYFSSLRIEKGEPVAGVAEKAALAMLARDVWMPVSYFMEFSPMQAKDSGQMRRFYAQSWLFVHMMRLSPAYRDGFAGFYRLLGDGVPTEEALRKVYGKTASVWDDDARAWARRPSHPIERLKPPPALPSSKPETRAAVQLEVDIARNIIFAYGNPQSNTRADYSRLARLAGERCDLQPALGDLAYAARLWPQASLHYSAALKCGSGTDEISEGLELAMSHRPEIASTELEPLAAQTGSSQLFLQLGTGRFFEGDYAGALEALARAGGLPPSDEFRRVRLQALGHAHLQQFEEAGQYLIRLTAMARDEFERQSVGITREDIARLRQASEGPPPEPYSRVVLRSLTRVDGVVTRVDCLGDRARFWIQAGQAILKLLVDDPSEVISGDGKPLEFACGPQQREIIAGYKEQPDSGTETVGRLRYLEFR